MRGAGAAGPSEEGALTCSQEHRDALDQRRKRANSQARRALRRAAVTANGAAPPNGDGRLGEMFQRLLTGGSATLVTERVLSIEGQVVTRVSETQVVHLVAATSSARSQP